MEILHLIFNIKEVWTPEFAYVVLGLSHISDTVLCYLIKATSYAIMHW
jgi:hypothetical protein